MCVEDSLTHHTGLSLSGCKSGHGPAAKAFKVLSKAADAEVAGAVTLNGTPLSDGRIIFRLPRDQFVGTKLNAQGDYTVFRVPVGTWKVTIEGEGVPAKYASEGKTPVLVQVMHQENVNLNFDLR